MALKSGQHEPEKSEVIEEALDDLDKTLDRLRVMYEQYFLGIQKQAPSYIHLDVERKIRDLTQLNIRNTGLRYRYNTLQQKFGSYNSYWRRTLRQIEQGTYIRSLSKLGRKAAQSGEEIPEEILAAMPKLMRERVKRDREAAVAIAKRQRPEGAEANPQEAPLAEAGGADGKAAAVAEVRRELPRGAALRLDENDDFDIDRFFAEHTENPSPPPPAATPVVATPAARPVTQGTATSATPPSTRTTPPPLPQRGPPAVPAQRPTGPLPTAATGPLPMATGPLPVVTGPLPTAATGPLPMAATGPLPMATRPLPVVTGPLPTAATGPLPMATGPLPVVTGPLPTVTGALPTTPSPGTPPRPQQPPMRQTGPVAQPPMRQTGPVAQPPVRPTGPLPHPPPVQPGPLPHPPPVQPGPLPHPAPVQPGTVAPPVRQSGPAPIVPAAPTRPAAPSQGTRPIPVAPGATAHRTPPPVQSAGGRGRPEGEAPVLRPPPGMSDGDVDALYNKYVKAKAMVGEQAAGPQTREKLLRTINAQAPKIMEQYKATGVDFSVVVKDNQVIIRAKPKP